MEFVKNSWSLVDVSQEPRGDRDLVREAVKSDPTSLIYASDELRNDSYTRSRKMGIG